MWRLVRTAALILALGATGDARGQGPTGERAGEGALHSSLSWVRLPGAEGCVSAAALARAVEAQLGRRVFVSASEAELSVEARAERVGDGWRAVLEVSDASGERLGERTLESASESCEELGELVALTISLMIDPLSVSEPALARDGPQEPPEVILVTEEIEVPVEVPGPPWRLGVHLGLGGALGLLPPPAIAGVMSIIVEPPGFVPIVLEGALLPLAPAETSAGRVDFLHVHGGIQLCPLALGDDSRALHGCLGLDAGAVFVLGGTLGPTPTERPIAQGHAALRGLWRLLGPLTLHAALHLLVPFRGEPFLVGGAAFYTPEPIAGMLDVGVGLSFL